MKTFIIFVLIAFCKAEIPSYIKVCKRNNPEIANCIKDSLISLRGKLATGITELNLPGIEPLLVPSLSLRGNTNLNLTDLYVHGPSTYQLIDLTVDIDKNRFAFLFKIDEIKFNGNYDIDMNILRIPLKASGMVKGDFKNVQMTGKMHGKKIKMNGKTHLMFKPIELKLYSDEAHFELSNLFKDQPALNDAAHELINSRDGDFAKEVIPLLESTLAERFTELANRITSQFTYNELFPAN